MLNLSPSQTEKLAEVMIDIGKALIIAGFAVPTVSRVFNILIILRSFLSGIATIYFGLKLLEFKGG